MSVADGDLPLYYSRRLAETQRAPSIPPALAIDLARDDDLDDDALEDAVGILGEPNGEAPYGESGFGVSEILGQLLSTEPNKVAVEDLTDLQNNLIAQKYVRPGTEADGNWTPQWASALRRADRDARQQAQSGHGVLATTIEKAAEFLGNTMPSNVFQGLVGAAKGLVEQGKETLPRQTGHPSLMGLGMAVDLFTDDPNQKDESIVDRIKDSLNPFDDQQAAVAGKTPREIAGVALEDIGWLLSAASMISGVGGAATAATSGAAAARQSLMSVVTKAPVRPPSLLTRIGGAAIKPFSETGAKGWIDFAANHGLRAQMSRPLLQTVRNVYSGLSEAQMGARYAGGLGSGARTTRMEAQIENAPELPSWVDNTFGLVLNPNRFFSVGAGDIAQGLRFGLGDTNLQPYMHVAQVKKPDGRFMSLGETRASVLKALGDDPVTQAKSDALARLTFGMNRRAGEMLRKQGRVGSEYNIDKLFTSARSTMVRTMRKEAVAGPSPLATELASYSYDEPFAFASFLQGLEGSGSGIERFGSWRDAQFMAQDLTRRVRDGATELQMTGRTGRVLDFDIEASRARVSALNEEAKRLRAGAGRATDPNQALALHDQANQKLAEAATLKKSLKDTGVGEKLTNQTLVPVRLADPANGIPGYATREELERLASQYETLSTEATAAFNATAAEGATANLDIQGAYISARDPLNTLLDDLSKRRLISDTALAKGQMSKPTKHVATELRQRAKLAAREVHGVDPETESKLSELGYKLAATGEDMLFLDDMDTLMELKGVGDYTKRAAFFETLGLSPFKHTNDSLFALKQAHTQAELGNVFSKHGMEIDGRKGLDTLYKHLTEHNDGKGVQGILSSVIKPGDEPLWKRISLYKIDPKQLSGEDIVRAFKLEDRGPEAYDIAADIHGALQKGAAFGGDVTFRHPIDSARMVGKALRADGLPGFSNVIRTAHITNYPRAGAIAGAALGATVGAADGEGFAGALEGAVVGGIVGGAAGMVGGKTLNKRLYGYLPSKLHEANMALRYTLSPIFDLSRRVEQNAMGFLKAELPVINSPKRYIQKHFGEEAWDEALEYWTRLNGSNVLKVADDIDRRAFQAGMSGFVPRYHEAAQAFVLKRRGWNDNKIRETVAEIGRYGLGRTGAEKSVNFVMFPFSFQKKFVTALGDFLLQAPARNVLVHEGLRRYWESSLDERFAEWSEKHLPMANQLRKLNNLSYGISAGRFFLKGLDDHKSGAGKAAQAIASLFVPSGASTPLAQAAGGAMDETIDMFLPIVIEGEDDLNGFADVLDSYIPLVKDLDSFFNDARDQVTATAEGAAPDHQFERYVDGIREIEEDYEPMALALGYASAESFLNSEGGAALAAEVEARKDILARENPTGHRMANTFTNEAPFDKQALVDLARKSNRSVAEEAILDIAETEETARIMAEILDVSQEEMLSMSAGAIRDSALKFVDDKRFVSLFNRFFKDRYGPIETFASIAA